MPILEVKLYIYQLFRSLAYIHSQGICHRDIKPQNLLLDPASGVLKLCDFGSAKILVENEPNVSYICSRYYRAPELIFGATNYTTKIGRCRAELALSRNMLTMLQMFGLLDVLWRSLCSDNHFFQESPALTNLSRLSRFLGRRQETRFGP